MAADFTTSPKQVLNRSILSGRTLGPTAPHVRLATPGHIIKLMARTITQVRKGELDPRIGLTISRLSWIALEAMKFVGKDSELKTIGGNKYRLRRIIEVEPESPNAAHTLNQPNGLKAGSAGDSGSTQ